MDSKAKVEIRKKNKKRKLSLLSELDWIFRAWIMNSLAGLTDWLILCSTPRARDTVILFSLVLPSRVFLIFQSESPQNALLMSIIL